MFPKSGRIFKVIFWYFNSRVAPELFSVTGHPNATNWNVEQGYIDMLEGALSLKFYPQRVIGTGPTHGLTILLHLDPEHVHYFGQIPIQGFKVMLHAPAEVPQPTKNFFIVTLDIANNYKNFNISFPDLYGTQNIYFLLQVPIGERVFVSVKPDMVETAKELHDYPPSRKLCYLNSENPLKFFKVYTQRHCELECTSKFMEQICGCVYFAYPSNVKIVLFH